MTLSSKYSEAFDECSVLEPSYGHLCPFWGENGHLLTEVSIISFLQYILIIMDWFLP